MKWTARSLVVLATLGLAFLGFAFSIARGLFLVVLVLLGDSLLLFLLALLLLLFRLSRVFGLPRFVVVVSLLLYKLVNAQHALVELRLRPRPQEVVETEHRLNADLLFDYGHVFEACLLDVVREEAVCVDGEQFGPELGVDCGVELDFEAAGGFPVQQFLVQLPALYLLLAIGDLLQDALLFGELVDPRPKDGCVFSDFWFALADQLGDLVELVPAELLASCHEVVEVLLRPLPEASVHQLVLQLQLLLAQWLALTLLAVLQLLLALQQLLQRLPLLEELVLRQLALPLRLGLPL